MDFPAPAEGTRSTAAGCLPMPATEPSPRPADDTVQDVTTVENLLASLRTAGGAAETVSVDDIRRHLGRRAFGPILAVAALPSLTPIATIPLLPTTLSAIILLSAGQMLAGMRQIWLPRRLLRLEIGRDRLNRLVGFVLPAARLLDRVVRPRLMSLTQEPAIYLVSAVCLLLALLKPPLELVPFTGGIPALPIFLFGVAITARDGALVLVTLALVAAGAIGLAMLAHLLI